MQPAHEVLVDDAIACGKERENVFHKVLLVSRELLVVDVVVREVDFLRGPKGRLGLLVHQPDVAMLDGKEHKALLRLLEHVLLQIVGMQVERHDGRSVAR